VITLALEASTYHGSAALLSDATLIGERSVAMRGREHEALMPAVADILDECGVGPGQIERVICGAGPGSFTSLRIAGSIAKGIAMASGAALVPVSSLALLVGSQATRRAGRYLAALDAMRGEHYVQEFEIEAEMVRAAGDLMVIPSASVDELARERSAFAVGPDRSGEGLVIPHARAVQYITNLMTSTAAANLAEWEPGYGRLAEAQVKWEKEHGQPLQTG
jgi:tRNA threonylcarbamoyladenosine biosynthesis protein TsaB